MATTATLVRPERVRVSRRRGSAMRATTIVRASGSL